MHITSSGPMWVIYEVKVVAVKQSLVISCQSYTHFMTWSVFILL